MPEDNKNNTANGVDNKGVDMTEQELMEIASTRQVALDEARSRLREAQLIRGTVASFDDFTLVGSDGTRFVVYRKLYPDFYEATKLFLDGLVSSRRTTLETELNKTL